MANENRTTSERVEQVNLGGKVQVEIKPSAENKSGENLWRTFWLPLVSAVVLVALTAGLTAFFTARSDRSQKRWEMKREAGRHALKIIDQYFANQVALGNVRGIPKESCSFEPMDNKEVREVCNELIISCDKANTPATFFEILSLGKSARTSDINLAHIQKLRNDIRIELGFEPLNMNLDMIWVAGFLSPKANPVSMGLSPEK